MEISAPIALALGAPIALALGLGICAAGGLLASWAASRREGVDPAVDEMRRPAERQR